MPPTRRALISVSDKTGIAAFGKALVDRGFQLLSTGGTARELRSASLPVTGVSEVTGHPEIMDGRVKSLHPAIHGPLLARRDVPDDLEALRVHRYGLIDVVAVNLYPFRETVARGDVSVAEAMEQVDIGGPAMLRAAAKNHAHVFVVVDPSDYARVLDALDRPGEDHGKLRRDLAGKVFRHTGSYDAAIAAYLARESDRSGQGEEAVPGRAAPPPPLLLGSWVRGEPLRYGENPDQAAGFYTPEEHPGRGIAGLEQHHGKALSYNNLLDLDGALLCLSPFALARRVGVCIVKHTTPSGLALGDTVEEAYRRALATDPTSAFGSVIAVNREVDGTGAEAMRELFVECVVAPSFSQEAMEILTAKKNLRILTFPEAEPDAPLPLSSEGVADAMAGFEAEASDDAKSAARFLVRHGRDPDPHVLRGVYGGLLVQTPPVPPYLDIEDDSWQVVTDRIPTSAERRDLAFSWAAVYGVKSNAILLARDGATLGIGAGQMSRVDASRLAVQKAGDAGLDLAGCALASDAFFPFRDGVDAAAEAGVGTIIQPGGSVRDEEVVDAANEHGMAMVFTGRRLFRH